MVEDIYELKNKILQHVERETKDMSRIDVKEIGELVDMVKDLAEAEKDCWEASYYKAIAQGMEERSGYGMARQGYSMQPTRSGYTSSMGYDELIDQLSEEYRKLPHEEKNALKNQILTTFGIR